MDALCLDFINSDWHDYRGSGQHEDRLEQPAWIEQFLERWGLPALPAPERETRERLKGFRDRLRQMLEQRSAGVEVSGDDLRILNEALGASLLHRQITHGIAGYQLEAIPVERDWAWVQAEIAASCAELIAEHDSERVKFCENPDCRWAFYDESRPHSRRWCEEACANLIKVRRFRARQKAQSDSSVTPHR